MESSASPSFDSAFVLPSSAPSSVSCCDGDGVDAVSSLSTTAPLSSCISLVCGGGGCDEKVEAVAVAGGVGGRGCGGDDDEGEIRGDTGARTPKAECFFCSSSCPTPNSIVSPHDCCCQRRHHHQRDQRCPRCCCFSHNSRSSNNNSSYGSDDGEKSDAVPLSGAFLHLQYCHHQRHHHHNHHQQEEQNVHHKHPYHGPPAQRQQQQRRTCFIHDLSKFVLGLTKQTKSTTLTSTNTTSDPASAASKGVLRPSTMLLLVLTISSVLHVASSTSSSSPALVDPPDKLLYYNLMVIGGYNALVKPSGGPNNQLTVKMGLRLSQILDVDEKNQIITISVWLRQEWFDLRLQWDPNRYRGVHHLNIPSDDLWKPDIVLYNNADGDFVVTLKTKATVHYNGKIVWEPPAIYKSYCPIDVEFFPFDIQECFVKFSSWTYHGGEVDLQHVCNGTMVGDKLVIPRGVDMKDYYYNVEWDVLNVSARRNVKYYPCCDDPYPDITFTVTLKRRILFYTLNLIMPCISISCLAVLAFYLPSDSAEKISLSISILLALILFFLLLSEMTPPTSLVIPLIGKYLLFIMIVVTASLFLTVFSLHINFKAPTTDVMSPWVRKIFTEIMPKVLLMKRPEVAKGVVLRPVIDSEEFHAVAKQAKGADVSRDGKGEEYESLRQRHGSGESTGSSNFDENAADASLPTEVKDALKGVRYIANHFRRGDVELVEERDWKYISMVVDRFFLLIFTSACLIGTLTIFLYAPSLYDPRDHLALVDPNSTCQY